jgi:hypothetical protein
MVILNVFGRGSSTNEGAVVTRSVPGLIRDIQSAARSVFNETINMYESLRIDAEGFERKPNLARRLGKALEEMMGQEVNAIGLAYGDNPSQTFRGRQNGLPVTGYYTRASVEGAVASILSQVRVRATFAYLASRPEAIN